MYVTTNQIMMILISVAATGLVSFLLARYWYKKSEIQARINANTKAHEVAQIRITELERQLSVLGQTVLPISTAFQALLIKQLTHFHTPKLDKLLRCLGPPITLTAEEEIELSQELEARAVDMNGRISDSERNAARMLPYVIKRVRAEAHLQITIADLSKPQSNMEFQVVAILKEERSED